MYTYNQYTKDIDYLLKLESNELLTEGVVNDVLSGIRSKIGKIFLKLEEKFKDTGVTTKELLQAFKNRNIYSLLSYVKFSVKKLFSIYQKADNLIKKGVIKPFEHLAKNSELVRKLQKGGKELDAFIEQYPILKKVTGVVVAGLLMIIWLNMSFIGSMEYDFDFSTMLNSLRGDFSIEDLFTSPAGISMLTLFLTGLATGGAASVPWFGHTIYNLLFGLTYTSLKSSNINIDKIKRIKDKIKRGN